MRKKEKETNKDDESVGKEITYAIRFILCIIFPRGKAKDKNISSFGRILNVGKSSGNMHVHTFERIKLSLYAMENLSIVQNKYQLSINLTFATFLGK